MVTNLSEPSEIIYTEKYCKRGDMENYIKQLKLDLHSDRNSCSNFYANYFRLLLSSLSYILITELKNTHLKSTKLAKAYCGMIHWRQVKDYFALVLAKNYTLLIIVIARAELCCNLMRQNSIPCFMRLPRRYRSSQ